MWTKVLCRRTARAKIHFFYQWPSETLGGNNSITSASENAFSFSTVEFPGQIPDDRRAKAHNFRHFLVGSDPMI